MEPFLQVPVDVWIGGRIVPPLPGTLVELPRYRPDAYEAIDVDARPELERLRGWHARAVRVIRSSTREDGALLVAGDRPVIVSLTRGWMNVWKVALDGSESIGLLAFRGEAEVALEYRHVLEAIRHRARPARIEGARVEYEVVLDPLARPPALATVVDVLRLVARPLEDALGWALVGDAPLAVTLAGELRRLGVRSLTDLYRRVAASHVVDFTLGPSEPVEPPAVAELDRLPTDAVRAALERRPRTRLVATLADARWSAHLDDRRWSHVAEPSLRAV